MASFGFNLLARLLLLALCGCCQGVTTLLQVQAEDNLQADQVQEVAFSGIMGFQALRDPTLKMYELTASKPRIEQNFYKGKDRLNWDTLSNKIKTATNNLHGGRDDQHTSDSGHAGTEKLPEDSSSLDFKPNSKPGNQQATHKHDGRLNWGTLRQKIQTATNNLHKGAGKRHPTDSSRFESSSRHLKLDDAKATQSGFVPGQQAAPFTVETINGVLAFPSAVLANKSIIFHTFDNRSAFLECLWTSESSLEALVGSPENTHYVFMSPSQDARLQAEWMQQQLTSILQEMVFREELSKDSARSLQARFHFVTTPTYQLGNWLTGVLMEWACQDHGCGFSQAVFTSESGQTAVLKRLDARYDWLPSPAVALTTPVRVVLAADGCAVREDVSGRVAIVVAGGCSFSTKVSMMQQSSALGVVVYSKPGEPVQDMNCEGAECDSPPSIPATMIPYDKALLDCLKTIETNVSFQTTPSENFYFAVDAQGLLAEMGWLLYPSFQFFVWQAEWFDYRTALLKNLTEEVVVVPVINDTIMQGQTGVLKTVSIPSLQDVSVLELDASLSCPSERDEDCPPWDHTVHLYVCCNQSSPLCGMELGRWITPFRRRIGRWLTDVTPLAPLLTSGNCTFNMKSDAWWAEAWKPSLSLRLHKSERSNEESRPQQILPLFRGGTFNQSYNEQNEPYQFSVPAGTQKVVLYAVITGHGSDNNGCGEFCVTSHHFVVNSHPNVNTFTNAGTPTGCADRTPTGVEPNEHGTWLYGRDGWCDGREVDPWVVDITPQLNQGGGSNTIKYFGWFNGTDPNPTSDPGIIIMYSYIVMYA